LTQIAKSRRRLKERCLPFNRRRDEEPTE
jgi:hypothetical protein